MCSDALPLSIENLLSQEVREIDTWPFLPSGLLSPDTIGKILEWYNKEFENTQESVSEFRDIRKLSISWILAAAIGIAGNLVVNAIFGQPIKEVSSYFFIGLIICVVLVILFLKYFPSRLEHRFRFLPPRFKHFKQGFEKYIPLGSCTNDMARTILSLKRLKNRVEKYAFLITLAIIRDRLKKPIKIMRVSNVQESPKNGFIPFFYITATLRRRWSFLCPNVCKDAELDLRYMVDGLSEALETYNVYDFDTSPLNWTNRGPAFLNEVSTWNMDNLKNRITSQITL